MGGVSPSPCLKVIAESTSRSATSAVGGHVTRLRDRPALSNTASNLSSQRSRQSHFESRAFSQNGRGGK